MEKHILYLWGAHFGFSLGSSGLCGLTDWGHGFYHCQVVLAMGPAVVMFLCLFVLFVLSAVLCCGDGRALDELRRINGRLSGDLVDRLLSANLEQVDESLLVVSMRYADPAYAIYKKSLCVLRKEAAQALRRAGEIAIALGLRLQVTDSFRPAEGDPVVLSKMGLSGNYSRGITVDVVLLDSHGKVLGMGEDDDMPTVEHITNRMVLAGIMSTAGFLVHEDRCRQFDFVHSSNSLHYPVLYDSRLRTGIIID